ncbi:MAG TPA: hypothetical protein DCM14_00245 [Clostridiales bacterium UBA8153]|nr:hypothetical protein [Clostridiales bacterium UBA8153]
MGLAVAGGLARPLGEVCPVMEEMAGLEWVAGMRERLLTFLRGVWIGVAVVLPGISGGTAALVIGRYAEFLEAIHPSRWRREACLLGGMVLGGFGGVRVASYVLGEHPGILSGLLFGLVGGTVPVIGRHAGPVTWTRLMLAGTGALITLGLGMAQLPVSTAPAGIFLGGAVSVVLSMLPGVSGGAVLVALGQYQLLLLDLNRLYWPTLAVFGAGVLLGLLVLSRAVLRLLTLRPQDTMAFLGGMMVGSLPVLWPGGPALPEAAAMVAGALVTVFARRR